MVQYADTISDLQGKFPFQQAYAYDKKFVNQYSMTLTNNGQ